MGHQAGITVSTGILPRFLTCAHTIQYGKVKELPQAYTGGQDLGQDVNTGNVTPELMLYVMNPGQSDPTKLCPLHVCPTYP